MLLNFKRQFAEDVESGRKPTTFRLFSRRRPPRIGETLHLYTGARTKQCRRLGRGQCIALTRLLIDMQASQVLAFGEPYGNRLLRDDEVLALASGDGFSSPAAFFAFFRQTYRPRTAVLGWLVRWELITERAAA